MGSILGSAAFHLPLAQFSLGICALALNLKGTARAEPGSAEKPQNGREIVFPFNEPHSSALAPKTKHGSAVLHKHCQGGARAPRVTHIPLVQVHLPPPIPLPLLQAG